MPERLVICGGARRAGGGSILKLALSGRSQNISLKLEDISKKLVRNIPSLLADLIEIAAYVFCADQATSRGGKVQQGMGTDWRRDFRFIIPVRSPSHWSGGNIVEALSSTLSFLSDDNYAFEFEEATNRFRFKIIWSSAMTVTLDLGPMKSSCSLGASIPSAEPSRSSPRMAIALRWLVIGPHRRYSIIKSSSSRSSSSDFRTGSCMFRCL
jgi:hypothetical protein